MVEMCEVRVRESETEVVSFKMEGGDEPGSFLNEYR